MLRCTHGVEAGPAFAGRNSTETTHYHRVGIADIWSGILRLALKLALAAGAQARAGSWSELLLLLLNATTTMPPAASPGALPMCFQADSPRGPGPG